MMPFDVNSEGLVALNPTISTRGEYKYMSQRASISTRLPMENIYRGIMPM